MIENNLPPLRFSNASIGRHYLNHVDLSFYSQGLIVKSEAGKYWGDVGGQINFIGSVGDNYERRESAPASPRRRRQRDLPVRERIPARPRSAPPNVPFRSWRLQPRLDRNSPGAEAGLGQPADERCAAGGPATGRPAPEEARQSENRVQRKRPPARGKPPAGRCGPVRPGRTATDPQSPARRRTAR